MKQVTIISRAEQSRAEQSRAEQSRAEQSRAEQSRAEQRQLYTNNSRTLHFRSNLYSYMPGGIFAGYCASVY